MSNNKKLKELRLIPLIIFLSSSFLIIFTYMLLSDIPLISSLLNNYLISGNSIFFPTLPNFNTLWFLPKKFQIIHMSIGQCIDIVIILNLICYIESIIYHYIKWTILNKDAPDFICLDSFFIGSKNRNSERCEEFELILDLKDGMFSERLDNTSENYKLDGRNDLIYGLVKKKKYISYSDHKIIAFGPFKLILNNHLHYLLVFYYYSIFDYFWISCSKNHYSLPDINNFTDFTEQMGGKP